LRTFGKLLCSGSSFPLNVGPYQWPVPHQISPYAPMLMKAHLDAQLYSPAYSLGSPAIQPLASIRGLVMLFWFEWESWWLNLYVLLESLLLSFIGFMLNFSKAYIFSCIYVAWILRFQVWRYTSQWLWSTLWTCSWMSLTSEPISFRLKLDTLGLSNPRNLLCKINFMAANSLELFVHLFHFKGKLIHYMRCGLIFGSQITAVLSMSLLVVHTFSTKWTRLICMPSKFSIFSSMSDCSAVESFILFSNMHTI